MAYDPCYSVESDEDLQRFTAETDRMRALTEFLIRSKAIVPPADICEKQRLLVDHVAALEACFEAVRTIAGRSTCLTDKQ